jgi:Txe/YoeB family toxin of Txe-Axe toxin-antitoxin module
MPIVPDQLPSAEFLRGMFAYDPETGLLARHSNPTQQVGTISGGYWTVRAGSRKIRKAHRIIWKMMTGSDPADLIDHANNDGTDNRWSNLREATNSKNMANRRKCMGSLNKGVAKVTGGNSWQARVAVNGRLIYLGSYPTEQEAHVAYLNAAKHYFGEFARAA